VAAHELYRLVATIENSDVISEYETAQPWCRQAGQVAVFNRDSDTVCCQRVHRT